MKWRIVMIRKLGVVGVLFVVVMLTACQKGGSGGGGTPGPGPSTNPVVIIELRLGIDDGSFYGAPLPGNGVTMNDVIRVKLVVSSPSDGRKVWFSIRVEQNSQVLARNEFETNILAGQSAAGLSFQARTTGTFQVIGEVRDLDIGGLDRA